MLLVFLPVLDILLYFKLHFSGHVELVNGRCRCTAEQYVCKSSTDSAAECYSSTAGNGRSVAHWYYPSSNSTAECVLKPGATRAPAPPASNRVWTTRVWSSTSTTTINTINNGNGNGNGNTNDGNNDNDNTAADIYAGALAKAQAALEAAKKRLAELVADPSADEVAKATAEAAVASAEQSLNALKQSGEEGLADLAGGETGTGGSSGAAVGGAVGGVLVLLLAAFIYVRYYRTSGDEEEVRGSVPATSNNPRFSAMGDFRGTTASFSNPMYADSAIVGDAQSHALQSNLTSVLSGSTLLPKMSTSGFLTNSAVVPKPEAARSKRKPSFSAFRKVSRAASSTDAAPITDDGPDNTTAWF